MYANAIYTLSVTVTVLIRELTSFWVAMRHSNWSQVKRYLYRLLVTSRWGQPSGCKFALYSLVLVKWIATELVHLISLLRCNLHLESLVPYCVRECLHILKQPIMCGCKVFISPCSFLNIYVAEFLCLLRSQHQHY